MKQAIGCLEFQHVASGIRALHDLLKSYPIEVIYSGVQNPGKYLLLFKGTHSSVSMSIESIKSSFSFALIDAYLLGNPHDTVLDALDNRVQHHQGESIGIIETATLLSAIVAADLAIKAAVIHILRIDTHLEMGGKGMVLFTGDTGAVIAAIEKATSYLTHQGTLIDSVCLSNPDPKLWESIVPKQKQE